MPQTWPNAPESVIFGASIEQSNITGIQRWDGFENPHRYSGGVTHDCSPACPPPPSPGTPPASLLRLHAATPLDRTDAKGVTRRPRPVAP